MRVLVLSTYESGHRPLVAATAAEDLIRAGHSAEVVDLAVDEWPEEAVAGADAVVLSVPMHTALRLAGAVVERLDRERPGLPRAYTGLYADFAPDPAAVPFPDLMAGLTGGIRTDTDIGAGAGRLRTPVDLPALDRYARMERDGEQVLAAAVETTRGCSHRCRHCPVPVVFAGRTERLALDSVLASVSTAVADGARHVTFVDPDFLNAPPHARRVVAAVHAAFPDLTWDCTVKVEHILDHRDDWPAFATAGCIFVVSAFESTDDHTLTVLDKGHTAAGAAEAVHVLRASGIEVRPTWLPFTPWTRPAHLVDLVDFVAGHDLIPNVDPVQYSVRLLLPPGSLLLGHPEMAPHLGHYDADRLTYTWSAPDPVVDDLQARVAALVEEHAAAAADPVSTFLDVNALFRATAGAGPAPQIEAGSIAGRPRLTEPWFC